MKALTLLLTLLFAELAVSQESVITWSAFSTGYESAASESASAHGMSGQIFVGGFGNDTITVGSGFFVGYTPASTTVSVSLSAGWNMVSVPVVVNDFQTTSVFPGVTTNVFAYLSGSYSPESTLVNGRGYWVKYRDPSLVFMTGVPITLDTIDVAPGWNLIGSISNPVPVSSIASLPGGLVTSTFFGYDASYKASDTIRPGKAYWVKATEAGMLIFSSRDNSPSTSRIRIIPAEELPPLAPEAFRTGEKRGMPTEFGLSQNYPNPFNPVTIIRYQIPDRGAQHGVLVQLKIYDVLGREVATLVDEEQSSGYKSVEWDAGAFTSGIYFYKLQAGQFGDVKKLILLK